MSTIFCLYVIDFLIYVMKCGFFDIFAYDIIAAFTLFN